MPRKRLLRHCQSQLVLLPLAQVAALVQLEKVKPLLLAVLHKKRLCGGAAFLLNKAVLSDQQEHACQRFRPFRLLPAVYKSSNDELQSKTMASARFPMQQPKRDWHASLQIPQMRRLIILEREKKWVMQRRQQAL
ncbi:unnamed protein product [Amoebophrya sp. A25]|nr:unnamed protein product [Amoebophrya sp. A25]|eukprot:GSA25T00021828001.1